MKTTPPVIASIGHLLRSAVLACIVLPCAVANAQILPGTVLYSTNFTGVNGSSPAGWQTYTTGSNSITIQDNSYRFNRPAGGAGTAMFARYMGEFAGVASGAWTDYRVDTILSGNTLANSVGRNAIILRWQTNSGPANNNLGYAGYLRYVDATTIDLRIVSGFSNGSNQTGDANGTLLGNQTFTFSLANNTDYRLSFAAAGSQLTLSLATMDNATSFSTSVFDTTYDLGAPGLRTYQSVDGRLSDWDDFTVTAVVPEPSSLALIIGGLAAVGLLHRFRKKD
jgi:hypothetical protein